MLSPARNLAANTPIVVNATEDVPDANPGDGVCETFTGNGACTLRAAIEEAEALAGADVITFNPSLPNPATFLLYLGHLQISTDLTITGNGSDRTIIDGDGSVTNDRVFLLTNPASNFNVTISGVTIQNGKNSVGGGIALTNVNGHLISLRRYADEQYGVKRRRHVSQRKRDDAGSAAPSAATRQRALAAESGMSARSP